MPELLECEVLRYHNSDRLQKFGLTTPETRRLRGDLIEVFKMFKGFDNITLNDFFKLSSTTLRGHTLKIYKPNSNPVWAYPGSGQIAVIWMLRNFFTVRNSIPILLINCETIATFNKTSRLFTKESGIYIYKLI